MGLGAKVHRGFIRHTSLLESYLDTHDTQGQGGVCQASLFFPDTPPFNVAVHPSSPPPMKAEVTVTCDANVLASTLLLSFA